MRVFRTIRGKVKKACIVTLFTNKFLLILNRHIEKFKAFELDNEFATLSSSFCQYKVWINKSICWQATNFWSKTVTSFQSAGL